MNEKELPVAKQYSDMTNEEFRARIVELEGELRECLEDEDASRLGPRDLLRLPRETRMRILVASSKKAERREVYTKPCDKCGDLTDRPFIRVPFCQKCDNAP